MKVTITTAVPTTAKQLSELTDALTKKYGKGVEITTKVDEKVIGGIAVSMGSQQLNATTAFKLQQLRTLLSSGN